MASASSRAVRFRLRDCMDSVVALTAPAAGQMERDLLAMVYDDVPDHLVGDIGALTRLLVGWLDAALSGVVAAASYEGRGEPWVLRVMLDEVADPHGARLRLRFSLPCVDPVLGEPDEWNTLLQRLEGSGSATDSGFSAWFTAQEECSCDAGPRGHGLQGRRAWLYDPHPLTSTVLGHRLRDLGLRVSTFDAPEDLLRAVANDGEGDSGGAELIVLGMAAEGPAQRVSDRVWQDLIAVARVPLVGLTTASPAGAPTVAAAAPGKEALLLPKSAPRSLLQVSLEALLAGLRDAEVASMPIYDRAKALELAGGSEELAQQLLEMLREELPQRRDALRRALEEDAREELRHVAHKLRGGASYCGVLALERVAGELEQQALEGGTERVRGLTGKVEHEIRRVLEWRPGSDADRTV
jgi:HPt (histidine-containing phosphotransfer) domain-containing protein